MIMVGGQIWAYLECGLAYEGEGLHKVTMREATVYLKIST